MSRTPTRFVGFRKPEWGFEATASLSRSRLPGKTLEVGGTCVARSNEYKRRAPLFERKGSVFKKLVGPNFSHGMAQPLLWGECGLSPTPKRFEHLEICPTSSYSQTTAINCSDRAGADCVCGMPGRFIINEISNYTKFELLEKLDLFPPLSILIKLISNLHCSVSRFSTSTSWIVVTGSNKVPTSGS